eukprot:3107174-Rhodomonas_salina.1
MSVYRYGYASTVPGTGILACYAVSGTSIVIALRSPYGVRRAQRESPLILRAVRAWCGTIR